MVVENVVFRFFLICVYEYFGLRLRAITGSGPPYYRSRRLGHLWSIFRGSDEMAFAFFYGLGHSDVELYVC